MDFVNRLKGFLGLSPDVDDPSTYGEGRGRMPSKSSINDSIVLRENPPELRPADDYDRFGFNVFSSPLEMHRYFEHQMNEMMKSFGMLGNHDSFFGNSRFGGSREPFFDDNTFGNNDMSQFPGLGEFQKPPGSLREQYLRPGYEQVMPNVGNRADQDLDGKFDMGDLDSVLTNKSSQMQPRTFIFGQSMTTKTIRNPDGSIETHKTVKDQQGNEETTITRTQGDKEYSVTTRTDKNGHQEIIENLINIDENDKHSFFKNNKPYEKLTDDNNTLPTHWFPFDKCFK